MPTLHVFHLNQLHHQTSCHGIMAWLAFQGRSLVASLAKQLLAISKAITAKALWWYQQRHPTSEFIYIVYVYMQKLALLQLLPTVPTWFRSNLQGCNTYQVARFQGFDPNIRRSLASKELEYSPKSCRIKSEQKNMCWPKFWDNILYHWTETKMDIWWSYVSHHTSFVSILSAWSLILKSQPFQFPWSPKL